MHIIWLFSFATDLWSRCSFVEDFTTLPWMSFKFWVAAVFEDRNVSKWRLFFVMLSTYGMPGMLDYGARL